MYVPKSAVLSRNYYYKCVSWLPLWNMDREVVTCWHVDVHSGTHRGMYTCPPIWQHYLATPGDCAYVIESKSTCDCQVYMQVYMTAKSSARVDNHRLRSKQLQIFTFMHEFADASS